MAASTAAPDGSDEIRDIIYEAVYHAAQKMGMSSMQADDQARMVEREIRARCGGERWYIPAPGTAQRDQQLIADRMMGFSVSELQQRYQLSRSAVYSILNRHRDTVQNPA